MNREILAEFNRCDWIPAERFNKGGLDIHFDIVHPMWRIDKVRKQGSLPIYPFYGEIFYQRVMPLSPDKTPEQEHLSEVRELKNGVTRLI